MAYADLSLFMTAYMQGLRQGMLNYSYWDDKQKDFVVGSQKRPTDEVIDEIYTEIKTMIDNWDKDEPMPFTSPLFIKEIFDHLETSVNDPITRIKNQIANEKNSKKQ